MKPLKRDFLSILKFWKTNCEFSCSCNSFSNLNYTCTRKGGDYCGLYRTLNSKPQDRNVANPAKQTDEEVFPQYLPNPSLYEPTTAETDNDAQ